MDDRTFNDLALLCEEFEKTKSRLKLSRLIAEFLQQLDEEEIGPAVRLMMGSIFPQWDSRTLRVSWRTVWELIEETFQIQPSDKDSVFADAVDAGEAVRMLMERREIQPPAQSLGLLETYNLFEQVAITTGRGSRHRKEAPLKKLYERSTPVEAKQLTKILLGVTRERWLWNTSWMGHGYRYTKRAT